MKRVLIADDEPEIRNIFSTILEKQGYEVETAANGDEAVKIFKASQPDLVLLDIIMPEKDGVEALGIMLKESGDVKIIAVSGGGRIAPEDYLKMAKVLGAHKTLRKPVSKKDLIEAVREQIGPA